VRVGFKIVSVLRSRSGASLLFVLGVLMMILLVGTSVMAAATGNIGINIRQERFNAAMLLSDSINRNIKHSLNVTPADAGFEESLAYQLVWAVFDAHEENAPLGEIELGVDIPGVDMGDVAVTLEFPFIDVRITDPVGDIPELGIARVPRTARISARMVVTVEIETVIGLSTDRLITTQAIFEYRGGVLSDYADHADALSADPMTDPTLGYEMDFHESEYGSWELLSFEVIAAEFGG